MARKNLGRTATTPHEIIDKQYADTKYVKPTNGIPGTDLAPSTVTFDKLALSGSPSATTWIRGDGTWAPIVGNNIFVAPTSNYTLEPPVSPIDGELVMFEIKPPLGSITVTIPDSVRMTTGMLRSFPVRSGISAIVGIRWSDSSSAWQMIALTMEGLAGGRYGAATTYVTVSEILLGSYQNGTNVTFSLSTRTDVPGTVQVFRNGLMEIYGSGYTTTETSVTLSSPPLSSDSIVFVYQKQDISNGGTRYITVSQTVPKSFQNGTNKNFTISTSFPNAVQVFRNGIMELLGVDFFATESQVALNVAPSYDDTVVLVYQMQES